MKKRSAKTGLILADMQYPEHNPRLLSAIEKYMATQKFDYLIYLGDTLDMTPLSPHDEKEGNRRAQEKKRLQDDYDGMGEILRRHRKLVGKNCEMIFLIGNHEEWADRFVDKHPQLERMLEAKYQLPLQELGIEVIPPRQFKKIEQIYFIHGDINKGPYQSPNHAKKIVETYNRNIIYGHHHTFQAYTKLSPFGIEETHTAYCIPALANIQPEWAGDRPNAWLNGFGVFLVSPTNFTIIPVISVNDSFHLPSLENVGLYRP